MIIIAGVINFDTTDNRDRAVELSHPLQLATRQEEPGCMAYCFSADPCVETQVAVYELWADEPSLAAHFEHPNYFNMRAMLGECGIVEANVLKHRCDLSEPVYDDTRTPRADFFTA